MADVVDLAKAYQTIQKPFLLARKAQRQPTLVLAHARTRFTSPDVDAHFASGEVVVVFLEDELELVAGQVQRRQVLIAREPVATYGAPAFCVLVDQDNAREIDGATYRRVLASAEAKLDLLLDLTTTVSAGRHPTGRREDGAYLEGSVTKENERQQRQRQSGWRWRRQRPWKRERQQHRYHRRRWLAARVSMNSAS